LEFAVLWWLSH